MDKVEDGVEAVGEKWNPTVYKPAPLRDTFRADMDRAKKEIQKIHDLYRQRNDAARAGKSTGRYDYQLQAGQADLELAVSSLEKYEGIYQALAREGDEALQQLEVKLSEAELTKRCQELIEVRQSAEPISELITGGTTNIQSTITGMQ